METPRQRTIGMMGRHKLDGGMIFLFSDIKEKSFDEKLFNTFRYYYVNR